MKIRDLCENTADEMEKALVNYALHKHTEHERLHSKSKFMKGFWKGKKVADKIGNNPVADTLRNVHNWAKKHSK